MYRQAAYYHAEQPAKYNNFPWVDLDGLMEYFTTFADDDLAPAARQTAIEIIKQFVMPATSRRGNPFGVIEHLHSTELWYYPEHNYTTEFYVKTAWTLARAGRLLQRGDWLYAAERNLQWLLGLNHLNASYVCGVGDRQQAAWAGLIHVPGLRHGILPGAVAKGVCWGRPQSASLVWNHRGYGPGYGEPPGFGMHAIHDGQGFYPHGPATEITEQFAIPIYLACLELHQARMPMDAPVPDAVLAGLPPLPMGSANLVPNSGFADSSDLNRIRQHRPKWEVASDAVPANWDFNGDQAGRVTLVDDPALARFGRRCLRIEKRDDHRSAALHTANPALPALPAAPGQTWWVSVWVRGQGTLNLFALEYDAKGYILARRLQHYTLRQAWDRLDLEYAVPEKSLNDRVVSRVRFSLHLMPQGEVFVDDFRACLSPDIALPHPQRLE